MLGKLRESLERRLQGRYLETGKQTSRDFSDDDHLWAETLEVNVAKLSAEERDKHLKDLRKSFEADITDTEAYIDDAADRLRQVWELFKSMEPKQIEHDETLFRELKDRFGSPYGFGEYFRGGMGAEAVRDLLQQVDLDAESADLQDQVKTAKGQKQARAVKRLKVVTAFINSGNKPEMMILEAVPVIPPELRPMVQLDGGRFDDLRPQRSLPPRHQPQQPPEAAARPRRSRRSSSTTRSGCCRRPSTHCSTMACRGQAGDRSRQPPAEVAVSDMLKGKQGRFRQNLLGKRVDCSGRSGDASRAPTCKLHRCDGAEKLMALELFKPFIMAATRRGR